MLEIMELSAEFTYFWTSSCIQDFKPRCWIQTWWQVFLFSFIYVAPGMSIRLCVGLFTLAESDSCVFVTSWLWWRVIVETILCTGQISSLMKRTIQGIPSIFIFSSQKSLSIADYFFRLQSFRSRFRILCFICSVFKFAFIINKIVKGNL